MSSNHSNKIVVASAGSRKTTYIVKEALSSPTDSILILTYTIDNINQIRNYIIRENGFIPTNITILSWFSFLLQECVRPYQNVVYSETRIETVYFPPEIGKFKADRRFIKKENIKSYFLVGGKYIINEHISEFSCLCNDKSNGKVIGRLEEIYSKIFIDEVQDISGYDFDIVELLLKSKIQCYLVGDCRQATYFTTCSPKYKKYKGKNIINLFNYWENKGLCSIIEKNDCYRSNQIICDFADGFYPHLAKTQSFYVETTGHDGLFTIKESQVFRYVEKYNPTILRWDKSVDTFGLEAKNFGTTKGQTFDRVLIFPTDGFKKYLTDGKLTKVVKTKNKTTKIVSEEIKDSFHLAKFYVATTRARQSVTFVFNGKSIFDLLKPYEE
jgi:hypothetical protein